MLDLFTRLGAIVFSMLQFVHSSAYDDACKGLARQVVSFMRSAQKSQGKTPAFMESGTCVPFPETVGNEVYQCLKRMELKRLNLQLLRMALNDKMERTEWECAFTKLFRVLVEMESIGSGNSVQ